MTRQTQVPIENELSLWEDRFPWPKADTHKYARGGLVVAGGGIETTGAARLVARAALRIGAGAVTVACDRESLPVYAAHLTAVMTRVCADEAAFEKLIASEKVVGLALGPGLGRGDVVRAKIMASLATRKPLLLDADALTEFAGDPETLFASLHSRAVLTPHEGEFRKLFAETALDPQAPRESQVIQAARLSGAVVLLKGEVTMIAEPSGKVIRDRNGTPDLATAGSGDTLSGMIAGLMAQGMPPFDAACAGTWIHGKAAQAFGPGLIAEDLPDLVPGILANLKNA